MRAPVLSPDGTGIHGAVDERPARDCRFDAFMAA